MRAKITRSPFGKAITNLRKIQEQRRLQFCHNPVP
jgi:hypothetical protein